MAESTQHDMKNCTAYEAAKVILDGSLSDQKYVAQHYPFMTIMVSKAGENCLPVFRGLPEVITARKFENSLIKRLELEEQGMEEREDEVVPTAKPAKPRPKRKRPKPELETEPEEDDDDEEEEDEAEDADVPDYSTMSAMDLYKLCIERGIEAKKRCKAKTYIEMLEKWDEENAADDDEDEEDEVEEDVNTEDDDEDDDDWDI